MSIKPRRRRRRNELGNLSSERSVGTTTDPFAFTDIDDPVSVVKQARKKRKRAACKTKNKTTKSKKKVSVVTALFKTQQTSLLRSHERAKLESEEIERIHQNALKKIRKKI